MSFEIESKYDGKKYHYIVSVFIKKIKIIKISSNFILRILGFCPQHGLFKYPKRFRMNTQYVDDASNYMVGCKDCKTESDEYWDERWREYYAGCL